MAKIDDMLSKIDTKLDEVSDAVHKVDKELALQKAAFDDHIVQDEKMYEEFKRMNDILQENTKSLQEHMQQTQLLKKLALEIDARLSPIEQERIEQEAVKKYRKQQITKIGKILAVISAIVAIIVSVKSL